MKFSLLDLPFLKYFNPWILRSRKTGGSLLRKIGNRPSLLSFGSNIKNTRKVKVRESNLHEYTRRIDHWETSLAFFDLRPVILADTFTHTFGHRQRVVNGWLINYSVKLHNRLETSAVANRKRREIRDRSDLFCIVHAGGVRNFCAEKFRRWRVTLPAKIYRRSRCSAIRGEPLSRNSIARQAGRSLRWVKKKKTVNVASVKPAK